MDKNNNNHHSKVKSKGGRVVDESKYVEAIGLYETGQYTMDQIVEMTGVSSSTLSRRMKAYREQQIAELTYENNQLKLKIQEYESRSDPVKMLLTSNQTNEIVRGSKIHYDVLLIDVIKWMTSMKTLSLQQLQTDFHIGGPRVKILQQQLVDLDLIEAPEECDHSPVIKTNNVCGFDFTRIISNHTEENVNTSDQKIVEEMESSMLGSFIMERGEDGILKLNPHPIIDTLKSILDTFDNVVQTYNLAKDALQVCHDKESDYQHNVIYAGWTDEKKAEEAIEYEKVLVDRRVIKNFIELYGNLNYFVTGETYRIFKEKVNTAIERINSCIKLQQNRTYTQRYNPENDKDLIIKTMGQFPDKLISDAAEVETKKETQSVIIQQTEPEELQVEEQIILKLPTDENKRHFPDASFIQSGFFDCLSKNGNGKININEFHSRYVKWLRTIDPDIKPIRGSELAGFLRLNGYIVKRKKGFECILGYRLIHINDMKKENSDGM